MTYQLVYVAGYGRSGSTLLGIMLGQHPDLLAAGELYEGVRALSSADRLCTCGATIADCSLWSSVRRELQTFATDRGQTLADLEAARLLLESRHALAAFSAGKPPSANVPTYQHIQKCILDALTRDAGNRLIVDTSKTARAAAARPVAMKRLVDVDVKMIHLIRDPRGIIRSALKGTNTSLEAGKRSRMPLRAARAMVGWTRANEDAEKVRDLVGAENTIRIRFESLIERPREIMEEVCKFLTVDPSPIVSAVCSNKFKLEMHFLGGNRMRLGPISLDQKKGRAGVSSSQSRLCNLFLGKMMARYGY